MKTSEIYSKGGGGLFGCLVYGCGLAVLFAIALALMSCRATKSVSRVEVKRDSVYLTSVVRDSVLLRDIDSVFVVVRGDSVIKERYKTIYRDRTSVVRDTVYLDRQTTKEHSEVVRHNNGRFWFWFGVGLVSLLAVVFVVMVWFVRKRFFL